MGKMVKATAIATVLVLVGAVNPAPYTVRSSQKHVLDIQGHRGGRGEMIENTLPAFAWGLIDSVTTLEMDKGITKDGVNSLKTRDY